MKFLNLNKEDTKYKVKLKNRVRSYALTSVELFLEVRQQSNKI